MKRLEREILELPLERVDAETMCKRRIHLERLARLAHLRLLAHVLDRAQVVQTVGELDQNHPQVLRHREDELAVVLGLRDLATLELDARQLRDAFHQLGDLVAELGADVVDLDVGVLDRVVEERGREDRLVELEAGQDLRRSPRVVDELLPGAAQLAVVGARREVECPRQELAVGIRLVVLDLGKELVDEVLVSFEYRHLFSVRRKRRFFAEHFVPMLRRRRKIRRLRRVAQMLALVART